MGANVGGQGGCDQMKLSVWAKREGITYQTAWRMFKAGRLPMSAKQYPTGTIIVDERPAEEGVALYARVSSHEQKKDLEAQLGRLAAGAAMRRLEGVASGGGGGGGVE